MKDFILTSQDLNLTTRKFELLIYKPFARFNDDRIFISHSAWIKMIDKKSIVRNLRVLVSTQIPNNYNWLFYEDKDFPNFFHPILRFDNKIVEVFSNLRKIEAPSIRIVQAYILLGRLLNGKENIIDI